MEIPLLAPLRQTVSQPVVADLAGDVRRAWLGSHLPQRLRPGDRVAVAVGSRGISRLNEIVRATLAALQEMGAEPFVVAAMGSHGGATAEGQRQILEDYGICEEALGVPVKTDMETVRIGVNSWGEPVFWDKNAWEADAVVTIARIKPHSDYRGRFESGIVKMLVIGLGKREGAAAHHRWGVRGLRDLMPESAQVVLQQTKFLAGLAVLENAHEETALLRVVERENVLEEEPQLLEQARAWMGRLPFEQLDLLVIGEIGKNYSGVGIDPNVVGRLLIEGEPEPSSPRITRICALDLAPESHGNAVGVGIADLTTARFLSRIDQKPFHLNVLVACCLWRAKVPIHLPTDRACIETGLATCWQPDVAKVRMAIIPNTLELSDLWVSSPLLEEATARPDLSAIGELQPLPFDATGNLEQEKLFPKCARARRGKE